MPTFLHRIFLLYNLVHSFLLCLVPKKVRPFLPRSWFETMTATTTPSSSSRSVIITKRAAMESGELKRVFQMFDRNGDGRITKKELNDSLENVGIFIPDKELALMIEKIDVDGDGCVDMEEFGELYRWIMNERDEGGEEEEEEEEEEEMREAFNVFDQNEDGFISVEELRSVLSSLGLKQGRTVEECKKMIMKVDVDGDGMVDYKEFKRMMKAGAFTAVS